MANDTFSDIGRVEAIRRLFEGTPFEPFGGAWFESGGSAYISSYSRVFLEGIDFNLVYFPLRHLGYKCTTMALGHLLAGLYRPRSLSVCIGVSAKLDFPQVSELWQGIVAAAVEHRVECVSLDLVPSRSGLAVSLGASGERSMAIQRPAARSKDLICVSGSLGSAYLGMQLLEKAAGEFGRTGTQPSLEKYKMIVGNYLRPEISPEILPRLEAAGYVPSFGYLVTHGLADAVRQLVRDSGLGAKVYASRIPFEGNSFELGKELGIDPVSAAMNGGDDVRLLFTVPIAKAEEFRRDFQDFDIIGHLALPEVGAVLVTPEGAELPLRSQGWKDEDDDNQPNE